MAVHVEKLPNEPIIITVFKEPSSPNDQAELWATLVPLVEGMEGSIYRITDLSMLDVKFGQMVSALAHEAKANHPGSAADPRIRSVLVARSQIIELAAKSISQEQYGSLKMPPLFETLEEALAYCRTQIAKEAQKTESADDLQ